MSALEQVEEQVKRLTRAEQEALFDWLGNMLRIGVHRRIQGQD